MCLLALAPGCSHQVAPTKSATAETDVKAVSAKYKREHDAPSLLVLFQQLKPGMPRAEVEELLGTPAYSPIEGQYYYAAEALCSHDIERQGSSCGVVVEYRRGSDSTVSNELQSCWFGAIGE